MQRVLDLPESDEPDPIDDPVSKVVCAWSALAPKTRDGLIADGVVMSLERLTSGGESLDISGGEIASRFVLKSFYAAFELGTIHEPDLLLCGRYNSRFDIYPHPTQQIVEQSRSGPYGQPAVLHSVVELNRTPLCKWKLRMRANLELNLLGPLSISLGIHVV